VWGSGVFGQFKAPCKVIAGKSFEIMDFKVSRGGHACLLSKQGKLYTWGENS
jgi:alpha-tubulin suppressor-like RCC1 family protein